MKSSPHQSWRSQLASAPPKSDLHPNYRRPQNPRVIRSLVDKSNHSACSLRGCQNFWIVKRMQQAQESTHPQLRTTQESGAAQPHQASYCSFTSRGTDNQKKAKNQPALKFCPLSEICVVCSLQHQVKVTQVRKSCQDSQPSVTPVSGGSSPLFRSRQGTRHARVTQTSMQAKHSNTENFKNK